MFSKFFSQRYPVERIFIIPLRRFSGFDDRQRMFKTHYITDLLKDQSYERWIPELPVTVKIRGVEDDVIMDMSFVGMCSNYESMISLSKSHILIL